MNTQIAKKITKRTNRIKQNTKQAIQKKPEDSQKLVNRDREFLLYVLWKAMPPIMRGENEAGLRQAGIDEEAIALAQIPTQVAFAEQYKLNPETLVNWNKKIEEKKLLEVHEIDMQGLTKNVNMAFYKQTILHADAPRVALWHRLFGKLKGMGDPDTPPTVVNQHFTQTIINMGNKYDDELEQKYREALATKISSTKRVRADRADGGQDEAQDHSS